MTITLEAIAFLPMCKDAANVLALIYSQWHAYATALPFRVRMKVRRRGARGRRPPANLSRNNSDSNSSSDSWVGTTSAGHKRGKKS